MGDGNKEELELSCHGVENLSKVAAAQSSKEPRLSFLAVQAIAYALYVGVGVSMTIHWFSDFAAGAILGTVIGVVVGKSFSLNQQGTIFEPMQQLKASNT